MCYYYATFYCVLMYTVGLRIIILYTFIKFSHLCRLLKTGNTSQWWLTVSSFGSLFVFVWLGQWASSCSLCFRTTTPPLLRTWSITETRASNSNFNLTEKWTLVPLTNTALGFFATWKVSHTVHCTLTGKPDFSSFILPSSITRLLLLSLFHTTFKLIFYFLKPEC